ncbi:hypothetical protein F5141DRAFT_1626 [Pisolithus sp. B1]|nr:hypothetical protein F5141DRAFT_1626 [Pisolithus sp. B1]
MFVWVGDVPFVCVVVPLLLMVFPSRHAHVQPNLKNEPSPRCGVEAEGFMRCVRSAPSFIAAIIYARCQRLNEWAEVGTQGPYSTFTVT